MEDLTKDLSKDLNELGSILCNYYRPSHDALYPLRRLNVEIPLINYTNRKNELTSDDRKKIQNILPRLYKYVNTDDHYKKYYIKLCIGRLHDILS